MHPKKVSDHIIKQTAELMQLPEYVVDQVIGYQWESAAQALKTYPDIELTHLGSVGLRINKAKKKIKLLEKYRDAYQKNIDMMDEEDPRRYTNIQKHKSATSDIAFLEQKIKAHESKC